MDRSPSTITPQLLVADEDHTACTFLPDNLIADGYHVDVATTGNDALAYLRGTAPDLILADVNGNTLALVDQVRSGEQGLCAAPPDTPIIALTSHADEVHRVRLLERGSDDVIAKPFSYPELRARVQAVLRRTAPRQPGAVLTAGPVRIDRRRRTVTVGNRAVEVRGLEYALLCALGRGTHPGVHAQRAHERDLGLHGRAHTDPRQSRQPTADQAGQRHPPPGHQRLGRRLPAHRWAIALEAMTPARHERGQQDLGSLGVGGGQPLRPWPRRLWRSSDWRPARQSLAYSKESLPIA